MPETVAPLVRSWSRLSARSSVVLPEPDGPISEVTRRSGMSKVTSRTAVRPLNDTATPSSRIAEGTERRSSTLAAGAPGACTDTISVTPTASLAG